jgi:NAD(P)-dependent dehydrogenase (short-subunit alcohol dehydrogenase family)
MMLKNKVAVIHGAGGAVGGAVARAFAREGAELFLTGHHRAPVNRQNGDDRELRHDRGGAGVIARFHHFHTMVGQATRENRRIRDRCVSQTTVDVLSAAIIRSTMIYALMTAVLW